MLLPDWLSYTYRGVPAGSVGGLLDSLKKQLGGPWHDMERGLHGYKSGFKAGGVSILYDGRDDMGVHVQVGGQGCRQLEAEGVVTDWQSFFVDRVKDRARFTRLDLAVDDRDGLIDLEQVVESYRRGLIVSRFASARPIECRRLGGSGDLIEHGLNFGARGSDAYLRIYDKRLEQLAKPSEVGEGAEGYAAKVEQLEQHWIRVELELRNERAQAAVEAVAVQGGSVVGGVLRGYVDFKLTGSDDQRDRWTSQPWWLDFLGWADKQRLGVAPRTRNIQTLAAWMRLGVAPSLAMLASCLGDEFVQQLVRDGAQHWGKKHIDMMAEYSRFLALEVS